MNRCHNIPFFIPHLGCPYRCSFCDQHVIAGKECAPSPEEVGATLDVIYNQMPAQEKANSEIAFFGGSFTAVDKTYRVCLLETARRYLGKGGFGGIRISTRPDCAGMDTLKELKYFGVTSIELGAQSMRDSVLNMNSRGHSSGDVIQAARRIKEMGFALGLQMMTGLDGDDDKGAEVTAQRIADLAPGQVRVYPTVVLEGTELARRYHTGEYAPPDVSAAVRLGARLLEFFLERRISVIRFGLHAGRDIEKRVVAGAYHPSLRELCEAEMMLSRAVGALADYPSGAYRLLVHPRFVSRMTGQKKANLLRLERMGYRIQVLPDPTAEPFDVRIMA